jgi:hypothetical protein
MFTRQRYRESPHGPTTEPSAHRNLGGVIHSGGTVTTNQKRPHSDFGTGVAAIMAGVLIFSGQAGELAFGPGSDAQTKIEVAAWGIGIVALVVAVWRLGGLVTTRVGRIGWRIAVVGVAFLSLFAVQAAVTAALTGDIPANFVLFAVGFLLLFVGHLLIAPSLRQTLGRAWMLPWVGAGGILVAITLDIDPIHDIGLFIFEGAWIAVGVTLLRADKRPDVDGGKWTIPPSAAPPRDPPDELAAGRKRASTLPCDLARDGV